ncbi:MAG: hypothetical protein ACKVX7_01745, partial [Planctomycetota bacterium]
MRRRLCYVVAAGAVVALTTFGLIRASSSVAGGPSGNGDVNGDGSINIGDPVYLLTFLFSSGPAPVAIAGGVSCVCDEGSFRITDPIGGEPTLNFGPTDDCSLGISAASPGLQLRDPNGIRILSPNPATFPELFFGPTDDCSLGIDAALPGLLLRDPAGIRILSPNPATFPELFFGPTDDCSIGIDAASPGLQLRDPSGIRILTSTSGASTPQLFFGPTDDCSLGIDAASPGLQLRDPNGIRILSPNPATFPELFFGPTDDCSLGI